MTFASFFLICFLVGFSLCALSFVFSGLHIHVPLRWHLPAAPYSAAGHSVLGGVRGVGRAPSQHGASASSPLSWLNPPALFAFLAWFGGVGYLLTQYYRVWYLSALGFASLAGCFAAAAISWFFLKVLLPREAVLDESDYELVGTIARANSSIREGGTGEIIFSQHGVRRCAAARTQDGKPLPKGREVVIARMEKGIAYVTPWEDWAK